MLDEMEALECNHTWELVPRMAEHNVLACKWVYKLTQDERGQISHHKARMVVNGMSQLDGINFQEMFASVIKLETIHLILSIAVINKWELS